VPPARTKPVQKSFVVRAVSRLRSVAISLVPARSSVAYVLVGLSPSLVGVGVGMELGIGWGLVAGGVGAFGVGWLLGAE
jgi:hypothetical protein